MKLGTTMEKINETKLLLLKDKIDKPLARLTKKKKREHSKSEMKEEILKLIPWKYKGP